MAETIAKITEVVITYALYCLKDDIFQKYANAAGDADVLFNGNEIPGAWLYKNNDTSLVTCDPSTVAPPDASTRGTNDINPDYSYDIKNLNYQALIRGITHKADGVTPLEGLDSETYDYWHTVVIDNITYVIPKDQYAQPIRLKLWKKITYAIGLVSTTVYTPVPEEIVLNACSDYVFTPDMWISRVVRDSGIITSKGVSYGSGDIMPAGNYNYETLQASIKVWASDGEQIAALYNQPSRLAGGSIPDIPPFEEVPVVDNRRGFKLMLYTEHNFAKAMAGPFYTVGMPMMSNREIIYLGDGLSYFMFMNDDPGAYGDYYPHCTTMVTLTHAAGASAPLPYSGAVDGWKIFIRINELYNVNTYSSYTYKKTDYPANSEVIAPTPVPVPIVTFPKKTFLVLDKPTGTAPRNVYFNVISSVDVAYDSQCQIRIEGGATLAQYNSVSTVWDREIVTTDDVVITCEAIPPMPFSDGQAASRGFIRFNIAALVGAVEALYADPDTGLGIGLVAPTRIPFQAHLSYAYDTDGANEPASIDVDMVLYINMYQAMEVRNEMLVYDPDNPQLLLSGTKLEVVTALPYLSDYLNDQGYFNKAYGYNRGTIPDTDQNQPFIRIDAYTEMGTGAVGSCHGERLVEVYELRTETGLSIQLDGLLHTVKGLTYSDLYDPSGTMIELFDYAKVDPGGASYPNRTLFPVNADHTLGIISQVKYVEPE